MRIMRLPEVSTKTGLSRSSIYLAIGKGTFPRPVSLGANLVGWVESELNDWIASRIAARDECGTKRGRVSLSGENNRCESVG